MNPQIITTSWKELAVMLAHALWHYWKIVAVLQNSITLLAMAVVLIPYGAWLPLALWSVCCQHVEWLVLIETITSGGSKRPLIAGPITMT